MKHYRRFLLLLAMLMAATFGMAQQAVTVKDSITHEAIPFVSVYFGNESGGYTDEQGSIVIPNGAKQIRLSHICYETKSVTTAAVAAQTIFLVPKSINLGEVAVVAKSPKRIKVAEVGLTKAKTQTKHKGANGFDVDLTELSASMVYAEVYDMVYNPDDYVGKTVRARGPFSYFKDEGTGNEYFAVLISDATACCSQGIEFVLDGDYTYPKDYPAVDTEITVNGVFNYYKENGFTYCQLTNAVLEDSQLLW